MQPILPVTKIFNDPVYGFISISDPLIQKLIDHPFFQRLGRISQGGLSYLVYPGAHHTRFHHAIGAMHLMGEALVVLKQKGIAISEEEIRGAKIAILLHDIGHGPFSHSLEGKIFQGMSHEKISLMFMQLLNEELHHQLETAISIFSGTYPRKFIHQLVSGQLDTDRMDYLMRDSFYTGVAEGIISAERIIKMMHVVDDELVIEEKGIYSVENFLIARRLMYWQVYLHKTVLGAETLLVKIIERARELTGKGQQLFLTSALKKFFEQHGENTGSEDELRGFALLDDHDIFTCIKEWATCQDTILSDLCTRLLNRKLFKIKMQTADFDPAFIQTLKTSAAKSLALDEKSLDYYVCTGSVANKAYDASKEEILILLKSGKVTSLFEASAHLDRQNMEKVVKRNYLCCPKEVFQTMEKACN